MSQINTRYIDQKARSNWMKLRTLTLVRWYAIAGQVISVMVAQNLFGLQFSLLACLIVIGFSALVNVLSHIFFPAQRRLSETETLFTLSFDIVTLCLLFSLTGGLSNPFLLLVLAPITISANVLPDRSNFILCTIAIGLITAVSWFYVPLKTAGGTLLEAPPIFTFGYYVAVVTGITFVALYTRRVTAEMNSMSEALLATQMALAREQKLTDLGGVVAATAHELGTPLATVKLVSAEMMEELEKTTELYQDAKLIHEQASRCHDILKSMGRAGKDDQHLKYAPWLALLHEAAVPHLERGKEVHFIGPDARNAPPDHPEVERTPEMIHGLRNLIQNAVDFAHSTITVTYGWDDDQLFARISDDGPGFPPQIIDKIGEPFVKRRRDKRKGYDGMGLGLFIAKTLLRRCGAQIKFSNSESDSGAVVFVTWPKAKAQNMSKRLGDNPQIAYP